MENIQEKAEDKITDFLSLEAGGRLVVFKPQDSDKDLAVEKRGGYKGKIVFLNVYASVFPGEDNVKVEICRAAERMLKPENNFFLLFVYFDVIAQDIRDKFLVIPSSNIQKAAENDDYSKFFSDKKKFTHFLISLLYKK